VSVVVDLVDLPSLAVAHVEERRHASIRSDGDSRIDGIHVTGLGKELELDEFLSHASPVRRKSVVRCARRGGVKVGNAPGRLKRESITRISSGLARTAPRGIIVLATSCDRCDSRDRQTHGPFTAPGIMMPLLPWLQSLQTVPEPVPVWTEVMLRLLAATAAGSILGLNRELTQKPAGLRTHALVSLGSALVTVSALQLGVANNVTHADAASRVIQGVVAGIGFIGGGVILHADGRNVRGLTTAATIWVAAALGISCGIGQWHIAGMAAGIALAVLVLGQFVERGLHRHKADDEPPK
jgi:putative Mg2+ transporter-C (MgtC) family protein